jgi:hypothetical protein
VRAVRFAIVLDITLPYVGGLTASRRARRRCRSDARRRCSITLRSIEDDSRRKIIRVLDRSSARIAASTRGSATDVAPGSPCCAVSGDRVLEARSARATRENRTARR